MRAARDEGFTLIEVAIVLSVLAIGLLGTLKVLAALVVQTNASVETGRATQAARTAVEQMRARSYGSVWASYQPGAVPGDTFGVPGLPPPADGRANQGTITFVGEPEYAATWGVAVDFDGDGAATSPAPATAADAARWIALPVRVRIDWGDRVPGANRSFEVTTCIYDRND